MNKAPAYLPFVIICMIACKQKTAEIQAVNADTATALVKRDSVQKNSDVAEPAPADSVFAYIKKISQKGDSIFIEADYIQFLTGKAAVDAAKKNHEADTMRDDNGKITDIIVDNDYYILNENKKLRELAVSKNADIETIDMASRNMDAKKTSLTDFIGRHGKESFPFVLKMVNNEVRVIHEMYIP